MQTSNQIKGWQALSNVSSFTSHVELRKSLNIFGQLDATLDYCEYLIRVQIHKSDELRLRSLKRKKQLNQDLVNALKSMNLGELIYYYNILVKQLINLTNNIYTPPIVDSLSFLIVQAFARSYSLKIWKKKKLRFDRQKHIIYAQKDKKIKIYDLENYVLRGSNTKDYFCLVLEAINNVPNERSKTVHIGFQFKNTFTLWFNSIKLSIQFKQWQRLSEILNKKQIIRNYLENGFNARFHQQTDKINRSQFPKTTPTLSQNVSQSLYEQTEHKNKKIESAIELGQQKHQTVTSIYEQSTESKQSVSSSKIHSILHYQTEVQVDQQKILRQCFINKFINQKIDKTLEQIQLELQIQEDAIKKAKKRVNFNKIFKPNMQLSQLDSLADYKLIQMNFGSELYGQNYIYQHSDCSNHFRYIYLSPLQSKSNEFTVDSLIAQLLDPHQSSVINKIINKTIVKTVIYSENAAIIEQQFIPYNRLYRPRNYVFLRHVMKTINNEIYIFDKSIDHQIFQQSQHIVRGTLQNIYKITETDHHIVLLLDLSMDSRGDATQNINHSKAFIKGLAEGLSAYFTRKELKKAKIKLYDYQNSIKFAQVSQPQSQSPDVASILNYSLENTLLQMSAVFKTPNNKLKKKQQSFYHIQGNEVVDDQQILIESIYTNDNREEKNERKYEMPRNKINNYLNPKLPFINNKSASVIDWKTSVIPLWKSDWLVDEESGGLVFKKNSNKQKQKLKKILQTVSKMTLTGKNIQKLIFPADILAYQSNLERHLKSLAYAPSIFQKCQNLNVIQKLRKTILFGILTSLLSLNTQKAFQPLLGETYQYQIIDNCQGYAQQISIDPPLSALLLIGPNFSVSTIVKQKIKLLMNSALGQNEGIYKLTFAEKLQIQFTLPTGEITGLIFNTRKFLLQQKSHYWIKQKNIVVELSFTVNNSFATDNKQMEDYFEGTIYQVTSTFMKQFLQSKRKPQEEDIVQVIEQISGRWTKHINFGQNQCIQFGSINLYEINNDYNSLPSDSIYRQDINALKLKDTSKAHLKKEELQERQRRDAQLRQFYFTQ